MDAFHPSFVTCRNFENTQNPSEFSVVVIRLKEGEKVANWRICPSFNHARKSGSDGASGDFLNEIKTQRIYIAVKCKFADYQTQSVNTFHCVILTNYRLY